MSLLNVYVTMTFLVYFILTQSQNMTRAIFHIVLKETFLFLYYTSVSNKNSFYFIHSKDNFPFCVCNVYLHDFYCNLYT
jgi:hypothetical protein